MKEEKNIPVKNRMQDCTYYKSASKCLCGVWQKIYCNKDCDYYRKETAYTKRFKEFNNIK